jgi:transposase
MVVDQHSLDELSAEQLREMAARLMGQLRHQSALLEKLSYENALLKRMKFAAQSERFNTSAACSKTRLTPTWPPWPMP